MGSLNVMFVLFVVVVSEYSNGLGNVRMRYCSVIEDWINYSWVRFVFGVKMFVFCGGSGFKVGG